MCCRIRSEDVIAIAIVQVMIFIKLLRRTHSTGEDIIIFLKLLLQYRWDVTYITILYSAIIFVPIVYMTTA